MDDFSLAAPSRDTLDLSVAENLSPAKSSIILQKNSLRIVRELFCGLNSPLISIHLPGDTVSRILTDLKSRSIGWNNSHIRNVYNRSRCCLHCADGSHSPSFACFNCTVLVDMVLRATSRALPRPVIRIAAFAMWPEVRYLKHQSSATCSLSRHITQPILILPVANSLIARRLMMAVCVAP